MIVTPGRLMFNRIVPPELREGDDGTPLNAGRLKAILQQVAEKQPDRYRDISHSILKFGARASTEVSASFGLDDLDSPIDKATLLDGMRKEEDRVFANKKLTRDQRNSELVKIYGTYSQNLPDVVFDAAMQRGSNLAKMVASGARGSKGQLNSNIGADFLMLDADSRPIPVPITSSYAEGLSPAEYYAAAYGTRRGLLSTKLSVAQSGYLSKQLSAAAHDLVVTQKDCTTNRGIPTTPDDKDNIGSVLARPTGGYPAGTVVTGRVLKQLRDTKVNNFIVRSPLTCSAHNGICSTCAGIREKNRFPAIMDTIGLASASSVGEPLSQGTLCLWEETPVRMADLSVKKIKDIVVGDWVLGANKDGRTFSVQVVNVFDRGMQECIETQFKAEGTATVSLVSTPKHKILCREVKADYTRGGKTVFDLQVLPVGTRPGTFSMLSAVRVRTVDGRVLRRKASPRQTVFKAGLRQTMDIEVDHRDHLFVLENGLIVSNSEKHSGGVASSSGKAVSAFKSIESLVQVPEVFPDVAPVAHLDGSITKIEDAPQGGNYVHIGGQSHYIPRGRELMVKPGDTVEAGDVLSSGTPNPAEIVRYKGIGSGRLYFVNALRKAMTTNKIDVDRRNLEVLGRSLINHVKVTDPEGYGSFLPDEVAEYDGIERDFSPEKHQTMSVAKAGGQYLARPALHYTIGTRITPSVIKTLNDSGEKDIDVMDSAPGFVPDMQRLADIPGFKADWMAQMAGSGLRKHILKNVHSGDAVSKIHGTSFIPGLAKGTEFGSPPPGTVGW